MSLSTVKQNIARRTGLTVAQDETDIEMALSSALEEIGANMEIVAVQKTYNRPILAGATQISFAEQRQRVLSVTYLFSQNGRAQQRNLNHRDITSFDRAFQPATASDTLDDNASTYTITGDLLLVGPRAIKTGGTLRIRIQEKLDLNDVDKLPDTSLAEEGAVANLLPDNTSSGAQARARFITKMKPSIEVAAPVTEQYSNITQDPVYTDADLYREGL